MENLRIDIWKDGVYSYPRAFGFRPNLRAYLHEEGGIAADSTDSAVGNGRSRGGAAEADSAVGSGRNRGGAADSAVCVSNCRRPAIIVLPGGGYVFVSPSEGEIVAKRFYEMGFQAFVLTYTTNLLSDVPVKDQAMRDLSRAVRIVRSRAEEFGIDPHRIVVCGFSASSHVTASLCVHGADVSADDLSWTPAARTAEADRVPLDAGTTGQAAATLGGDAENQMAAGAVAGEAVCSNRPDAVILSYPVITSGEYAHRGSFYALLGKNPMEEELDYWSLEKHVTKDCPPCFVWQTATDDTVPVQNSYLFAEALQQAGVPYAFHVFSHGQHGISLSNDEWAECRYEGYYTMEQAYAVIEAMKDGRLSVDPKTAAAVEQEYRRDGTKELRRRFNNVAVPEVSVWPELAVEWLDSVLPDDD